MGSGRTQECILREGGRFPQVRPGAYNIPARATASTVRHLRCNQSMPESTPSSPPKAFYVLAPLFSILITLLLIEGFLALFHPVPYSIERNMFFEPDPYTGYRLRPNSLGYFQHGIPARVNSQGHRDDEVSLPKPEGVFRILMLGDSFTVGANVRQEEAYPQVLEQLLNQNSARKIEVVNAGVGGWEPFMYAQYYEHYGRQYEPDLVLIGFFVGNDAYNQLNRVEQLPTAVLGRRVTRKAAANPLTRIKVFLFEHSHLVRLLLQKGPHRREFTREHCADFTEEYLALQRERMPTHLKRSPEREAAMANALAQIGRIKALA
ncbi:MAG: SGNH/GDSL hydrolase family protein, partial [Chloroflexi bacterium]